MLKITYLEEGIYLERLEDSVAAWQADRVLVSLRAGVGIFVEESTASLVLPIESPHLLGIAELEAKQMIEIYPCDQDYLEAILSGTWITSHEDSESGIFVCELDYDSEEFLYRMWQESQVSTVMSE